MMCTCGSSRIDIPNRWQPSGLPEKQNDRLQGGTSDQEWRALGETKASDRCHSLWQKPNPGGATVASWLVTVLAETEG